VLPAPGLLSTQMVPPCVSVTSFLVMLDRDVKEFLGFDKHFTDEGFARYRP